MDPASSVLLQIFEHVNFSAIDKSEKTYRGPKPPRKNFDLFLLAPPPAYI
jgi:hypothetical protein